MAIPNPAPVPVTLTLRSDSDENILLDLQSLGTSVAVTSYSSVSGQQVTFADTPSDFDVAMVLGFLEGNNNMLLG